MKDNKREISIVRSSAAEYLTFITATGESDVNAVYFDENVWLTQKMMGVLYNVGTNTINYHLKKIFTDREVDENSVIRKFRITATDGKSYSTNHYSLEMIIAVGFKVNNERAVQFRKWVNGIVKDYTIKGWVMDDDREILQDAGKITAEIAKAKAETEFEKYRVIQDRLFMSDFDKYMLELEENAKK